MGTLESTGSAMGSGQETGYECEYEYERAPDEPPSEAVVEAVAAVTGRAAVPDRHTDSESGAGALAPLYETLDPDALDALTAAGAREANCSVTFTYGDYAVTVRDRTITVTPVE